MRTHAETNNDAGLAALKELLSRTPHHLVGALDETGEFVTASGPLTDLPASTLIEAGRLDAIVSEQDRLAVAAAFEQVTTHPAASCRVEVPGPNGGPADLHLVDSREVIGTIVALINFVSDEHCRIDDASAMRPRVGALSKTISGEITWADDDVLAMLGLSVAELKGTRSVDLYHPDDIRAAYTAWIGALGRPRSPVRGRIRHRCAGGSFRWMEVTHVFDPEAPDDRAVHSELVDIDAEMAAMAALREQNSLFRRLAESLPLGLIHADATGNIVYANAQVEMITGVAGASSLTEQFASASPVDRVALLHTVGDVMAGAVSEQVELRFGDGRNKHVCDVRLSSLNDETGEAIGVIICVSDITESATLRRELHTRATRDSLTGCHNRESTMTALEAHLVNPAPGLTVVFVDLDKFKDINDTLGHSAGDAVLIEVAKRLTDAVRPDDIVGRFGGDEFIVISPGAPSADVAAALTDRLSEALDFEMIHDNGFVTVRGTLGSAWIDRPGTTADALVARADAAMYERKRGKTDDISEQSDTGSVDGLLQATERSELDLTYRPVVDLHTGDIVGGSTMVMWNANGRQESVQSLLERADASGAIVPVGQWVVERLSLEIASTIDVVADNFRFFLRVSDKELAASGPERLRAAAERAQIDPSSIVVMIGDQRGLNESTSKRVAAFRLAEVGFEIGLFDFGTGWSSIGMAQNLPISWLHIGQVTTGRAGGRAADELLASSQEFATRLGLRTVVDGITSPEHLERVRAIGADAALGPLFGQPLGLSELIGRTARTNSYP